MQQSWENVQAIRDLVAVVSRLMVALESAQRAGPLSGAMTQRIATLKM
jgi:hypothetical protein